jgi:hypothetical protein
MRNQAFLPNKQVLNKNLAKTSRFNNAAKIKQLNVNNFKINFY